MGNFRQRAIAIANTSSEVTMARERTNIDTIASRFPSGVTISNFDIFRNIANEKDENGVPVEVERRFAVINIAEDDTVYFYGRSKLNKLISAWAEDYGYSENLPLDDPDNQDAIAKCRNDYMLEEPVMIKIIPNIPMKNGGRFTDIVVL